jgi:hypothetical protein
MAEFIDLKADTPKWTTTNMKNPRKQFNATVLPDGTVLVTGGTSGSGFNDLSTNATVHEAELWNPFKQHVDPDGSRERRSLLPLHRTAAARWPGPFSWWW